MQNPRSGKFRSAQTKFLSQRGNGKDVGKGEIEASERKVRRSLEAWHNEPTCYQARIPLKASIFA